MFRRGFSIFVLLAFTASQLAVTPHAHAEAGKPVDHDALPHVHLSWFEQAGHCHDDEYAHHHSADDSHSQPLFCKAGIEHDDHDSDAVYLSNDTGNSLATKSVAPLRNLEIVVALTLPVVPLATSVRGYGIEA